MSNLHQIALATTMYLTDNASKMPQVPDSELQLTPPVDTSGKRYNSMGSFMPLLHTYAPNVKIWLSPPVPPARTNEWQSHFLSPWREQRTNAPERGWANYISEKLAEPNPAAARYLRGRTPESVAAARRSSVSDEEWLMSPFPFFSTLKDWGKAIYDLWLQQWRRSPGVDGQPQWRQRTASASLCRARHTHRPYRHRREEERETCVDPGRRHQRV